MAKHKTKSVPKSKTTHQKTTSENKSTPQSKAVIFSQYRYAYIVDGCRTPFLKAKGKPGAFTASNLAVQTGRSLLARQNFDPEVIDEVILGCVMPGADEANIARIVALRLGCGKHVPAWTVQRNCASGMQALDNAVLNITTGRSELVLAGGVESMSHAPVLFNLLMVNWLAHFARAKSIGGKMQALTQLRPKHLQPVIGLLRGLTDPVVGLSMGQTAENIAYRFGIDRAKMDAFAVQSHQRLAAAIDEGWLGEVEPVYDVAGHVYTADDGLRRDSSIEKLGKLKPAFDRPFGKVTAGNSAQVTDGAAMLILASKAAVKKHNLPVLGRISQAQWSALEPSQMGLGPAHAMSDLLQNHELKLNDIDYWEINEAFATQVLGCIEAWKDTDYCQQELGLQGTIGEIDINKLNVDGGGVSLGHPVGASGARIVLHLLHLLERKKARRGIASLCIGGGQGGAMLVERGE